MCGDQHDLVDGCPTGSVRISFGYMSTFEDADKFLNMIETCFVAHPVIKKRRPFANVGVFRKKDNWSDKSSSSNSMRNNYREKILTTTEKLRQRPDNGFIFPPALIKRWEITGELVNIYLYPVKSCAAFEVKGSWKLTDLGLEYDRRWMIINASGSCMSQKQIKSLCTLKPTLDFSTNSLNLTINDTEMTVPLEAPEESYSEAFFCDSQVCNDKVRGYDCGDKVAEWLSDNLERPGLRLLRQCDFTEKVAGRSSKKGEPTLLSLANTAEYLLINMASVRWLRERIPHEDVSCHTLESILLRFRPNFVVDFTEPFAENELDIFLFNDTAFKFSGQCTRCQMICIDQQTGEISKEPLQTLSKELNGKMRFGVYLSQCNPAVNTVIKNGCAVKAYL